MKKLLFFFSVTLFLRCSYAEKENTVSFKNQEKSLIAVNSYEKNQKGYKIIGIKDGDTFVLLLDGKEQVVRLAHIDCPEKKQPFGNKAKQFAANLCFEKVVYLIHNSTYDRNKRLIAEVILPDGTNLNKELVKNGLAWHFKKYSNNKEYAQLETEARNKKIGLWVESNPTPPWIWRKPKK